MNDRIEGIILKQTDYKDNALIVTVLTKEKGKISFIASGVKKISSKNAGNILPYMQSEFLYDDKEGKTIFRMRTAKAVKLWRFIHEDFECSLAAQLACQIADVMTYEDSDNLFTSFVYDQLYEALDRMNNKNKTDIILAVYLANILREAGIGPDVDECVLTGDTNVVAISVNEGGFLCRDCADKMGISYDSVTDLRKFRLINKAKLENYEVLSQAMENAYHELNLLIEFLRIHGGVELTAYELYSRITLH